MERERRLERADFREVSRLVSKGPGPSSRAKDGRNRSRSPKVPTKKQRGRVGEDHPLRGGDGRYRTTPTRKQICFEFLATQGGGHPKVWGRESSRVSGEFGCFRVCPGQGAKRPLDTGVESAKVDSKIFESCVPATGCSPSWGLLGECRRGRGGPLCVGWPGVGHSVGDC